MPNAAKWQKIRTPEMVDYVLQWYPSKGGRWCALKLGVPPHTVYNIARDYSLTMGQTQAVEIGKKMLLRDLMLAIPDASLSATRQAAKRDGVLRHYGSGERRLVVVSREWAEARIAEHREASENERQYSHYLTLEQTASKLGLAKTTVSGFVTGRSKRMQRIMAGVHVVTGTWVNGGQYRRYLFDPVGVDEAKKRLDEERHKARNWVSIKSLALEAGVLPSSIKKLLARRGCDYENLVVGCVRLGYVSPSVAGMVRGHYNVRRAA